STFLRDFHTVAGRRERSDSSVVLPVNLDYPFPLPIDEGFVVFDGRGGPRRPGRRRGWPQTRIRWAILAMWSISSAVRTAVADHSRWCGSWPWVRTASTAATKAL